eukprot:4339429-Pleurochrysis_carterae.AAC.1
MEWAYDGSGVDGAVLMAHAASAFVKWEAWMLVATHEKKKGFSKSSSSKSSCVAWGQTREEGERE